ncbi:MAG: histidine phosphatase family protein [Chloroflexi bacterium]|nr:histidine phosphatase family protein [Chloroflexota bacterium]
MRTHLYLIRHGRTDWNRQERYRGRFDLPLDQEGERQAQALAQRLAPVPLEAVYSSPLRRAWSTAQAVVQARGLEVRTLAGLLDIDYGEWQGLALDEAQSRYPKLYRSWQEQPQEVSLPGGESLAQVQARATSALEEVSRRHPRALVALVSHRVVCQVMLCAALGLGLSHFWQVVPEVASLQVLEHEAGRFRVALFNDACHLRTAEG